MSPDQLKKVVEEMCELESQGEYCPILEADITGFLYHLVLAKGLCVPANIHLDTRVVGSFGTSEKFDVVIGAVACRGDDRPAISPELVVEIKMFAIGFTDQQHRHRLEHILDDDLRKLGSIQVKDVVKVQFIFDHVDYLQGRYGGKKRRDVILAKRDETEAGIRLLIAQKKAHGWQVQIN